MNEKVLIVDDQSDIRQLIRVTLGKSYETLEAEDGVAALSIIRNSHPRVVILDVMMPGEMDGLKVLDAVKSDPALRDIRIIMVTARGQALDYEAGMSRGADGYFVKPFSPLQLSNMVREFMK